MEISDWSIAILVGGLATRLGPLTAQIPKALIPIAGQPFIVHQMNVLKKIGFKNVVLCTGHLEQQIKSTLEDGSQFGISIKYSSDGEKLRGTGGALRQALPLLSDPFMTLYGDSFLAFDYRLAAEAFSEAKKPALMTVYANHNQFDRSNAEYAPGKPLRYSKKNVTPEMKYIDYGLNILTHSIFRDRKPKEKEDLSEILEQLSNEGKLAGFEVLDRFYEIGSAQGIAELNALFSRRAAR